MDDNQLALLNTLQRDIKDNTRRLDSICVLRNRADIWLNLCSTGERAVMLTHKDDMKDVLDLIELKLRRTLAILKDQYEEL